MHKYPKTLLISVLFLASFLSNKALSEEALTWGACIEEARKNHPDLISAEESVKQYEAGKKITASTLYPQIDSSADASRARTKTTASGKTTKKTANSFGYGVTGRQLLFDGLKTANDIKAASENIKAAQYNYRFTSSEVRLRLRTAFINLLKAQESLKITQDIYDIRRGNLELITLRYESGIEHKGALLTAEANLVQSEFDISRNRRALMVAQRELIKEMGRIKFSPLAVEGQFNVNEAALEKPDFEALVNKNPSLGKLTAQKNAASFGIKAAKADFFPQVSAQTGVSKSNSHWPPDNEQLSAGLTLSLPLFEGGLRLAQVAQARAIFNQAQANVRSEKDSIILTLEQSWAALQDAVETVKVQNKFLVATEERAKIAEAQYSLGLIQFDNWTIIEDQLVNAKKSFLDAQANTLLVEASWVQAKGETLEYAN
jgi:TolC family type I secretion outer membrane protein